MKTYDCVVIGGGVVGASIFNKLVRLGKSVALLDKASDVSTGASKANSGIVHAGYDPMPNTLKAKLNVEGSQIFPKLCKRLNVPIKNCGALVVGDDMEKIKNLYERGKQNGVKKLEILNRDKIKQLVPDISDSISCALYAKISCIVSPYLFTINLCEEGIINGGEVFLEEDIESVKKVKGFVIKTKRNTFFAKNIINSAGAGYNDIAKILGSEEYEIQFRRGEYFVFSKTSSLNVPCTIFPLPTKKGKGVLITPTVDGNFLVGPTSERCENETVTTDLGLNDIKEKAKNILPNINFKNAIREFSGIRTICGEDFIIEKSKKVKNVINIAGICSPGLSSAPAIANMVASLLGYSLEERKNLKRLKEIKLLKDYDEETQNEMIRQNKDYGEIVCKCEKITKGDVINTLNRPLKIRSVDGVKRRTNAGMGICQGGFCFTKVVNLIKDVRNIKYEEVLKENRGSEVAYGNIREVKNEN